MLKFIRGKGYHPSAERLRLQKELFAFEKCAYHGFPNKPSALAWDPKLRLVAVGTRSGALRVYGAPGVEFYGQHENDEAPVTQLFFLPNQGRLISLCEDNSLHLWEINVRDGKPVMDQVKSHSLEGKLKKISKCGLETTAEHLLIGTEGGNIYLLDVAKFEMTETIIYQDVVMQNVPEDYKVNPGAVESITQHPTKPDKILIGYSRGLIVLWDRKTLNADQTYVTNQSLESVCWDENGERFMSSHNDGSYVIWSATHGSKVLAEPSAPYGPFPCKSITKALWSPSTEVGDLIVFGGGMPRASFGDRHTVTVMRKKDDGDEKHFVFDFTSKIVDFITISNEEESGPRSLLVLAEEELVAVDLTSDDLSCHQLPYLASLHASAITCSQYVSGVSAAVWEKLSQLQDVQADVHTWPVNGGVVDGEAKTAVVHDLLLTGHEDGTVRFWDAGTLTLRPLHKLTTGQLFTGEDMGGEAPADEDEWPPFRKVGVFDPYSDDPRLAVKKLSLCPTTGTLVLAGTAGQVVVLTLAETDAELTVEAAEVNLVTDRDNFVWKGHDKLPVNQEPVKLTRGYQPASLVQLHPPAAVTGLALQAEWGLIALGTGHGFSLFDYIQKKAVMVKCTLNPNDASGAGDTSMNRRKSFKKSLRESFRRLRKGRSQRRRGHPQTSPVKEEKKPAESPEKTDQEKKDSVEKSQETEAETKAKAEGAEEKTAEEERKEEKTDEKDEKKAEDEEEKEPKAEARTDGSPAAETAGAAASPSSPATKADDAEVKPVERAVEARPVDDAMGSMVRCLYLAKCYVINGQTLTPTLWAGTNSGAIYVFTLSLPEKREEESVSCQLGKEIQLKHRAPVIDINIIDGAHRPLGGTTSDSSAAPSSGLHRVVICSEEQFKVFSLPTLKPYGKFKLTAHEGSRVRRIGYASFVARNNPEYSETCLMCLTNQGDLGVYSVPDLRKQIGGNCTKREDITGILSLVFTDKGEALYLHSPSEYRRVSMSAVHQTTPHCHLELPEGMRPEPEPEPEQAAEPEVKQEEVQNQESAPKEKTGDHTGENNTEHSDKNNKKEDTKQNNEIPQHLGGGDVDTVKEDKDKEMPKENGFDDDDKHDLSAADITIDSVKDHLILSPDDTKVTEFKSETKSEVISTKTQQVKVVKTTLITTTNEVVRPVDE